VTAATVSALERPIVNRVARTTEARGWGLVHCLPVSPSVRTAIAVVLMDYTLYWWHVLLHRVPALWNTHEPHHIDRDLDSSTAVRFHALEFVASIPWRCAQIAAIGAGPRALALWQKLTLIEVLFHHSNLRLPRNVERLLAAIIVTPRLHGLHHSIVRAERDSNFSSGLSLWDRLHGTARDDFEHDDVTIGLPDQGREITLAETLALPFKP
jgi:sterol desaturase/sphingolipid hydroxylase (fatty acid hydroxylase superfamily)